MQHYNPKTLQSLILQLQKYWIQQGCTIIQAIDIEVGAGTLHPMTCLRAIGPEPIFIAYIQPSRRPSDGRYGSNPNRLQHYYQFQVIIKPSPDNIQELYLTSLEEIGLDLKNNDIRFVEDNWKNPTFGAWGLGWEIWLNGMEITQFTYFQQMGGLKCIPITGEITYGIERIAMFLQNVDCIYDVIWNVNEHSCITYGDIFFQNEEEQSFYNFEYANINFLFYCFEQYEKEAKKLIKMKKQLLLPSYEHLLKMAHIFNLLEARKAITTTERQCYVLRIRSLMKEIAKSYYYYREKLGFPMCKNYNKQL